MNNNHPPFRVGQRVVALETAKNNVGIGIVKGHIYTVVDLLKCKCCGRWDLDVGLIHIEQSGSECGKCGYRVYTKVIGCDARAFAPIDPMYADITKELAGKGTTEETSDVVRVRELN